MNFEVGIWRFSKSVFSKKIQCKYIETPIFTLAIEDAFRTKVVLALPTFEEEEKLVYYFACPQHR